MKSVHRFGHRPPEISRDTLGLGWISGVRRLEFVSAKASFWHRHEETTLLGCLKGEVTYEFHEIPPVTLSAGSFLVIPANVEHRHLGAIDPVSERVELLLDVRPRRKHAFSLFNAATARALHRELLQKALSPVRFSRELQSVFTELYAYAGLTPNEYKEADCGYIRLLVTRILYESARPHESRQETTPVLMESILEWLENHYAEPMPLNRIVAKTGFSRTHVFTLFKKKTGLTPADYLQRLRIRKACEFLQNPTARSKAVAEACGFASASVFNAVFKRQIGLTPLQWRTNKSV